jgi:hypothetical protein
LYKVSVLDPAGFTDGDELSEYISKELRCPVFSLDIHAGDLWMFRLFDLGAEVAWFNPRPDYWGEISDAERQKWSGDASVVTAHIPGLSANSISRYFVPWTEDIASSQIKAYSDDKSHIGEDWQMVDFMTRLGLIYPIESDRVNGTVYELVLPSAKRSASPPVNTPHYKQKNPWWKFW